MLLHFQKVEVILAFKWNNIIQTRKNAKPLYHKEQRFFHFFCLSFLNIFWLEKKIAYNSLKFYYFVFYFRDENQTEMFTIICFDVLKEETHKKKILLVISIAFKYLKYPLFFLGKKNVENFFSSVNHFWKSNFQLNESS